MWSGLLNDIRSLTHKDVTQVETEQGALQPILESQSTHQDSEELNVSPRTPVENTKRSNRSLSRRGSPLPSTLNSELVSHAKNTLQTYLLDEPNDLMILRITPVIEFIEYHRNQMKAKKHRGKTHRRRYSEPVHLARSKGSRLSVRSSVESITSPTLTTRSLGTVGKSSSLKDIFTLKKGATNGAFFLKPGQFLAHLRTQSVPSLQEVQRLQHILEGRPLTFVQKFVEKGGVMTLFTIMSGYSRKKQPSEDDLSICGACCACIYAILTACEEFEELTEKMTLAVSSLLANEIPQSADNLLTCENQIANIITICGHNLGHKLVLQEMKHRGDLLILTTLLQTDLSIERDTRTENIRIKVATLTLITKLIQNLEDQEEKFKLINLFLRLKLFPILMDVRRLDSAELQSVVSEVEDLMMKEYFLQLPRAKTISKHELVHTITIRIPIFNVAHAAIHVPYDPTQSTVTDVIAHVYKQASYLLQFDEKLYGIFLVDEAELEESRVETRDDPISEPDSPQPLNIYASIRLSRRSQDDLNAFSLASSGELEYDDTDSVGSKTKSPRMEKINKRRSYHKPQETVVQNPLYGKKNPILKQTRSRRLSIYIDRVLTLSTSPNEGGDEYELITSKRGEWLQGSIKVASVSREGWDLKLKPLSLMITWKKKQILVEVEPDSTTFSDVIENILIRLQKQDEDRIFEYNLVMFKTRGGQDEPPEAIWLEPRKRVSSLPPRVRELELRTRPVQLYIHSKDSTTHAVLVNDTSTLQQVIKEFGDKLGLTGRHLHDYGLYDKISDEWLETGDVLTLLQRENIDLHFLLRPRPIHVVYQIADYDLSNIEVTRNERITGNYTDLPLYESPSQSNFMMQGSPSSSYSPVAQASYLGASEFDGGVRGLPQEAHSFKSQDMLVHFTLCVSQVQIAVCKELGFEPEGYTMYRETADASVVELTPWKSLRNQGVAPNSHVLLLRTTVKEETGNDVNIWEETQATNTLRFEDGPNKKKQVVAGTLNQLVRVLTSETDHDVFFLETFMLTYRSFTDYKTLLRKLGERYTTPPSIDPSVAKTIKSQVCIVLKYWITHEDLADKDVILEEIAKFVDSIAEEFSDMVTRLEKFILVEIERLNASSKPEVVSPLLSDDSVRLSPGLFSLLDLDEYTIACQLVLQDSERFSKLKTVEFFNQAWLRNKAPNLLAMVAHFNSISSAVATSIVNERAIKRRVKIMEKHITIAMWLRKLNDFFSLQAFICAINSSAVTRLKFTIERISSQHAHNLAELEELMRMENSYKNYRQALREAKPPCVPHIGVYMTDLTFIDEGNPDNYGNLINFQKRTLVSKILMEIEGHREFKYQLTGAKKIEQFISSLPRLPENELYCASLECEPRGATKSSLK